MSRSAEAAEVLAALSVEQLRPVAQQFPPASEITLRTDVDYFRQLLPLSHDLPNDPAALRQALREVLAKQQSALSQAIREYQALRRGDLSSLNDKTLVQRFKTDPLNGLHVSLFMMSNSISFNRTMIAVVMEAFEQAES